MNKELKQSIQIIGNCVYLCLSKKRITTELKLTNMSESNREYFGAEYVVTKAEGLDLSGGVLTSAGLTDIDLAKTYNKKLTARVDGSFVGWASEVGFIDYYCNKGKYCKIEDITYWGKAGCRYHQMIQYCLQGVELDDLLETNDIFPTKEIKERHLGTYFGTKLPRAAKILEIKHKSLFDKNGNSLYK